MQSNLRASVVKCLSTERNQTRGVCAHSRIGNALPDLLRKFLQSLAFFASLPTWGVIPARMLLSFAARFSGGLYDLTVSWRVILTAES